jgi:ATP adenylyltransferase
LVAAAGVDLAATPDASFNILLTPAWMLVAPRSTDTWGGVFINSLGFAGYILVRPGGGEAALRERTPLGVLAEVGVARAAAAAAGAAAGAEGGGGSARA